MFKNLIVFQLETPFEFTPGGLEEVLAKNKLQPCEGMRIKTTGAVPVHADGSLVKDHEKNMILCIGTESKKIPAATLKRAVKEAAIELERTQGFKLGRKQLRDLKDKLFDEMLPGTPANYSETRIWIDVGNSRVMVDCGSASKAEDSLTTLRNMLESLPVIPPQAKRSLSERLTAWLREGDGEQGFSLGESCELVAETDKASKISYKKHSLHGAEIANHLKNGKIVSALEVCHGEDLFMKLNAKAEIKSLKYVVDTETTESASDSDEFMGGFILMSERCKKLIDDLFIVMEVTAPEAVAAGGDSDDGDEDEG